MEVKAKSSVLSDMQPPKAIVTLAVPATLALGAKDQEGANRTVSTIVGLSVAIGLILCVGGIFFMEPLLRSFGASEVVLPQAKDYAFWMFIAALANLPAQSMNCAARAESSVKISSIAVITGAVMNIFLDPVLMFNRGFGMGVEGASLATTISQFATFFILAGFYISGRYSDICGVHCLHQTDEAGCNRKQVGSDGEREGT